MAEVVYPDTVLSVILQCCIKAHSGYPALSHLRIFAVFYLAKSIHSGFLNVKEFFSAFEFRRYLLLICPRCLCTYCTSIML